MFRARTSSAATTRRCGGATEEEEEQQGPPQGPPQKGQEEAQEEAPLEGEEEKEREPRGAQAPQAARQGGQGLSEEAAERGRWNRSRKEEDHFPSRKDAAGQRPQRLRRRRPDAHAGRLLPPQPGVSPLAPGGERPEVQRHSLVRGGEEALRRVCARLERQLPASEVLQRDVRCSRRRRRRRERERGSCKFRSRSRRGRS